MKNRFTLKLGDSQTAVLRQLDDDAYACPICGEEWETPPYIPNDGRLGEIHDLSTPSFGDVCSGCGIEFGVDDGSSLEAWTYHRVSWLNRLQWAPSAVSRLITNLEMSRSEIEAEAEVVRAMTGERKC